MTLTYLKFRDILKFVDCPLVYVYLIFLPYEIQIMHFWQAYYKVMLHLQYTTSGGPSVGDINSNYLPKLMSAWFLHCKIIFLFLLNLFQAI